MARLAALRIGHDWVVEDEIHARERWRAFCEFWCCFGSLGVVLRMPIGY